MSRGAKALAATTASAATGAMSCAAMHHARGGTVVVLAVTATLAVTLTTGLALGYRLLRELVRDRSARLGLIGLVTVIRAEPSKLNLDAVMAIIAASECQCRQPPSHTSQPRGTAPATAAAVGELTRQRSRRRQGRPGSGVDRH